jgi:hypothetical protein
MLNRVFNFTRRREEPQAFEPRKRTMATTWYGRSTAEATEPATCVAGKAEDADGLGVTPLADCASEVPSATPIQESALTLDQMTLAIEDGLLMVFGPEGDPVPPQAFADAAAVRPEALLSLPDGVAAPASRVAAVLGVQTRGRLDGAGHGAEWILTMLQEQDWPEAESEDTLRAERASCVLTAERGELTVASDSGGFRIVDVAPLSVTGDALGLFLGDDAPISVAGLIGLKRQEDAPHTASGTQPDTGEQAGDDARAGQTGLDHLALRGTIEVRPDGLWLGVPGFAAHGGGVHLARWATSAPNGPVVSAVLTDGRAARLADLISFGVAAGNAIDAGRGAESQEVAAGEHDQAPVGAASLLAASGEDPGLSTDREGGGPSDPLFRDGPGDGRHDTFPFATAELGSDPGDHIAPYEQAAPIDSASELAGSDMPATITGDHAQAAARVGGGTVAASPSSGRQTGERQVDIDPADPPEQGNRPADSASGPNDVEQADVDPESILLVVIRGVPEDALLSAGIRDDDGSWSLGPLDLPSVMISLAPRGSDGGTCGEAQVVDGDLNITGIALAEDGSLVAFSETVPLSHYLEDPAGNPAEVHDVAAQPAADPASAPAPCGIPLEVDSAAWAGERFDALVIRDVPAGVSLSAGTYDPAVNAWVLRPQDLSALAVLPPAGLRADFTVTLMGVALRPGDTNAARVLARLPVVLA